MFHTVAGSQSSPRVLGILSILCTTVVLLGLPGISQAQVAPTADDARQQIRLLKDQISTVNVQIFFTDTGIALNKGAIVDLEKGNDKDKATKIFLLKITLAGLEATQTSNLREKTAKEKNLAEWEAYLRSL